MKKLIAVALAVGAMGCGPTPAIQRQESYVAPKAGGPWLKPQLKKAVAAGEPFLTPQEDEPLFSSDWFKSLPPEEQVKLVLYFEEKRRYERERRELMQRIKEDEERRRKEEAIRGIAESLNTMTDRFRQASRDYADRISREDR